MVTALVRAMVPRSNQSTAGGHVNARRLVLAVVAVLAVSEVDADARATREQRNPEVTVREDQGIYRVEARFAVPQSGSIVFTVLTDYEQIPRFMPDVQRSTVLDRAQGQAIVEQEATARFMMFSRRVHLVLDVVEEPTVIRFRDRCGHSFTQYQGSWQIEDDENGAAITYRLSARPSFSVPEFVLKRLLKRDATQMIERLRSEIAARSRKS